jgi:hypothetical protein
MGSGYHRFVLVSHQGTCLGGEHGVSSLSQTSKQNLFPAVAPAARERGSASRAKKPGLREAQRRRRLAVFREWDKGGTFAEAGRKFGLTGTRTREIVLKAVMGDGCRSDRARAWMARLDEEGYWLSRYDAGFQKGSRKNKKSRLPAVCAKTSSSPETHIPKPTCEDVSQATQMTEPTLPRPWRSE